MGQGCICQVLGGYSPLGHPVLKWVISPQGQVTYTRKFVHHECLIRGASETNAFSPNILYSDIRESLISLRLPNGAGHC